MLHVHASNRVERLVDALAGVLAQAPESPFEPDVVVVHSQGLERWLSMQLAARAGISANVAFPSPQALVTDLLIAVLGDAADLGPWQREALVWRVLRVLPGVLGDPAMALVSAYVSGEESEGVWEREGESGGEREGQRGRRRMALAERIAGLFERYSLYRPDWTRDWGGGGGTGWEPVLWRALTADAPVADLGALVERFAREVGPGALPSRLCLFCVSTLPPAFVAVLAAVARHVEVRLFVLSPSPWWWAQLHDKRLAGRTRMPTAAELEVPDTHPLLVSMGALARDFQAAIERAPHQVHPDWSDPGDATALHALQSDLYRGRASTARRPLRERSIQVHACHGPLRQVEALRDALLAALDELPGLEPRDILVMTPDISVWAPLIEAVLGAPPPGVPALPFRIADQGVRYQNPVASVVLAALDVVRQRLSVTAALDLLDMEPVRSRFGLPPDAMAVIREWAAAAGVRWGADADHRAAVDQPADERFTWRAGLDRVLLGHALRPHDVHRGRVGDAPLVLGVAPVGDVEGRDERAILAGWVAYAEALLALHAEVARPGTLVAWRDRLVALVDALVRVPEDHAWQVQQVRDTLAGLATGADSARFHDLLDASAVAAWLEGRFSISEPGRGFLTGATTVCQLVPMRSLPFRVIALLGLDDQSFPRTATALGFDRMASDPRTGDRSAREDDRALFLEALLSARDRLIVTYSGRGDRGDEVRPPAVPVAELLDVIDRTFDAAGHERASDAVIVRHPLQAYDAAALRGEPLAYDPGLIRAAIAAEVGRHRPVAPPPFLERPFADDPVTSVVLDDLVRFLLDPIGSLVRRRLGLWDDDADDPLEDREPMEPPEALGAWQLRAWLLRDALDGRSLDRGGPVWAWARAAWPLPLGTPGEVAYDRLAHEADAIATAARPLREGAVRAVPIDLVLSGVHVTGRVGDVFDRGRVVVQAGAVRARHRLDLWIRHLALHASGTPVDSRVIGQGGGAAFGAVERAAELLSELIALYRLGRSAPLPFFPEASLACARDPDAAPRLGRFELSRWAAVVLGGREPFEADLSDLPIPEGLDPWSLAERIWAPALAAELG